MVFRVIILLLAIKFIALFTFITYNRISILFQVPRVKLKKNEGELYLMSERFGWMVGNKDSFNVNT